MQLSCLPCHHKLDDHSVVQQWRATLAHAVLAHCWSALMLHCCLMLALKTHLQTPAGPFVVQGQEGELMCALNCVLLHGEKRGLPEVQRRVAAISELQLLE